MYLYTVSTCVCMCLSILLRVCLSVCIYERVLSQLELDEAAQRSKLQRENPVVVLLRRFTIGDPVGVFTMGWSANHSQSTNHQTTIVEYSFPPRLKL